MFHLLKPQDVLFLIVVIFLLFRKNPKLFVGAGLVCLLTSIPLFAHWVFFTAERLVYYAVGFLLVAIIIFLIREKRS